MPDDYKMPDLESEDDSGMGGCLPVLAPCMSFPPAMAHGPNTSSICCWGVAALLLQPLATPCMTTGLKSGLPCSTA